jgi:Kef-type K+ transport system membrane component KefB
LFKRLKLGAVLGYLAAGIAIGPSGLALVGDGFDATMELAEFGVVLLLFLVGLELEPRRLWVLRRPVFGTGSGQVLACGLALGAVGLLAGLDWRAAIIAGAGLAMSSTAMVLSSLSERGHWLRDTDAKPLRFCCSRTWRSFRCWRCYLCSRRWALPRPAAVHMAGLPPERRSR